MKRGEVWWAELPPPVGDRPVVILTRDGVVNTIGGVVVVLVTRTVRNLATKVILGRLSFKNRGIMRFFGITVD